MRGHGRSDRSPAAEYFTEHFIGEATAFLEQVVTGPSVVVGQFLGGLVALAVAARRPDLVRAVFSEDAVPMNGSDQADEGVDAIIQFLSLVGASVAERQRGLTFFQFVNRLAEIVPEWASTDAAGLVRFARMIEGTDPLAYNKMNAPGDALPLVEVRKIEQGIRCPVHVARGDVDAGGIVTAQHIEDLKAIGVDVTSTAFPGAGHIISSSQPNALLADLRAFLQRIGY
jgi:pimeloyl-ACP methyl ester carboxylesterase